MAQAIEDFIKKYRFAIAGKVKDFRVTIEEATNIVAEIALLKMPVDNSKEVIEKIDSLSRKIDKLPKITGYESKTGMDGGGFKS